MRKAIAAILSSAAAAAVIAIGWAATAAVFARPASDRPCARLKTTSIDLGRLQAGRVYDAAYDICNDGDQRLVLHELGQGCECLSAYRPEIIVPPHSTQRLVMRFDTTGAHGPLKPESRYSSNDPDHRLIVLTLTADIQ